MPYLPGHAVRRVVAVAALALAAAAAIPSAASAATPASLRMLATEHPYRAVTVTSPGGAPVAAVPGLLRLRITSGGTATEAPGFCVDARHHIATGVDYDVSLRTAVDDPVLAGPGHAEAAWLLQGAEAMIAAVPAAQRPLEAAAMQIAVWQLTGQAREGAPTDDAALNARTAAIRVLASGRALGGALAVVPSMARGCAGRGGVALGLTGVPGSTADLSVSGASAVVVPARVRFGADGTARADVASAAPGSVTVAVRAHGGTLVRVARARSAQTTPQETIVLKPAATSTASATVVFVDCPSAPLSTTPGTPSAAVPADAPTPPLDTSSARRPATPPSSSAPYAPGRATPRVAISKAGPARARAGSRVVYAIRVVNRGATTLRGLRIGDDLPDGMSLAATPAGSSLRGGRLVWDVGALAPRRSITVRVRVRIDADISGRRCNRATATASGAAARTAAACTRVVPLRRGVLPAVTA